MGQPLPTSLFSFLLLTLHLSLQGVISTTFTLVNQCNYTVWPASTGRNLTIAATGFVLKTGESFNVTVPTSWSGRFWGRTLCTTDSTGKFSCLTGDCGSGKVTCDGNRGGSPPATLAEFTVNSPGGLDFFDVSLVDGYNVPMLLVPHGGSNGSCNSTGCPADLNAVCPTELKVTGGEEKKQVVACQGPCAAFNLQYFCCAGNRNSRDTCEPSVYSQIFKTACPQAYSYPYDDDRTSMFTCSSSADYNIIFCPSTNTSLRLLDQGVSVGASLTAGNGTTRWLSPSGEFAFGFHQLPNNELFLLAIWYDKIPDKTIIWYANGDNPAPIGSRLELNDSRGLVLSSPQGTELWRSDFTSGTISSGLMNDTGNFLLQDKKFVTLWDSFSHPSDTLMPSQEMELNGNLSSRQGEFNFSRGRFKLHLQEDGNLVLNLMNLPSNYSYEPYYNTGTADAKNSTNVGLRLIFDKSGLLYILKKSGEMFSIFKPNESVSTDSFYYRAMINYDGVVTVAYYPKDPKNGQSWVIAQTIPENICNSTFTDGEGVCGFNSICILKDDQRPNCTCPEGYSLIDSNNMYGGCIPNFQVICQAGGYRGSQDDLYIMKDLPNTDWPKSDYEILSPSSLQECTKSCLQDCLCVLVTFSGSSCRKKKLPLSFGRKDQGVNGTSVMKLMKNDDTLAPFPNPNGKKDHDTLIIVISVLLGSSVFVILTLVGAICFGFSYDRKKIKSSRTNNTVVDRNLRNFTFKELAEATSNFGEELGRGSFSIVYKGTIDMTGVAVKKLDKLLKDNDKEFQTEVNVIGQTHHRNLVRLLGYCNEEEHRILVYELMSNGTLASFLFTNLKPNWNQRVDIALGVARGLVYLHEECCTQIIHCDIKPQNVLLDDQYNARISDFGLAKLLLINQSHTETGIRGTKGYVAPDWFRSGPITAKVDTYSFGVLLLEIICCRKNVEKEFVSEEKGILTDWAYDCYRTKSLNILLENDCDAVNDMKILDRFVMIAIWCIQEDPSLRPTMKKVLLMLEGIVEVAIPPSPYLYGSVSCN
ncbi:G-type lectin S-receptor-like serine/threonine-protein kinase RLK1 [Gastrolobium bilobum]|uniref:G-type lectin S-receptor-like serine/threonine-protein kinase RLK1 n=1 Tax=Gastrolobium bilobum TaxID=150636 RepID=UPI002AB263A2|nr:G-type lectin S-receptor-like serine/threonine-protein kinase RLK1 [Gastrolobium bilobum]